MDTYNIIPYDDRTQKHTVKKLAEWLPQHEFLMVIVAPAGSGKTTLLLNMLLRLYRQYWQQIYIFSPTIHNDAKWEHVFDDKKVLLPPNKSSMSHFKQRRQEMIKWCREHKNEESSAPTRPNSDNEEEELPTREKVTFSKKKSKMPNSVKSRVTVADLKNRKKQKGQVYKINDEEAQHLFKEHIKRRHKLSEKIVAPLTPDRQKALREYKSVILGIRNQQEPHIAMDDTSSSEESEESRNVDRIRTITSIPKELTFEEPNESTLQYLMDMQDKDVVYWQKRKKPLHEYVPRTLFVFDDMVGSGLFNRKQNNAFKRLTVRRRHLYSSVIGVTQAYKEIPKTTRTNANAVILFRIDSDEEMATIYSEYPMGLKWKEWEKMVHHYTREPYSFIMFNLQTSDPNYRIVSNFNHPISEAELAQFKGPQSTSTVIRNDNPKFQ